MSPTLIAACGKDPARLRHVIDYCKPDYEIIHICQNGPEAVRELPALLRGEEVLPASGLGTNTTGPFQSGTGVKAIVIGGGFPDEDFEAIRKECDAVKGLPFFRADTGEQGPQKKGPPPAEELSRRVKEGLDKGKVNGEWEEKFYWY